MVETSGDALQHGAMAACVFAGDRQNPEKSARHLIREGRRPKRSEVNKFVRPSRPEWS